MDNAIVVERVSKRYELGAVHHGALSQHLEAVIRAPVRRMLGRGASQRKTKEEFWALRDVSLEVEPGEVLGLVGANGAGKSTLLKLLARITEPTFGRIAMRGRVGSLLEVGTGFHPELSGRENVFLNGSILGMRRHEIAAQYDEIVEFSGVEDFLETPVKRYSSGMYVRLAFAVAAHLRTDVLLVDEVLSVGDAEFQRKCIGKLDDAAGEGRTVVFVSHNLSAVQRLCTRAVWIDKGNVSARGTAQSVIAEYLKQIGPEQLGGTATIRPDVIRQGSGEARLVRASMLGPDGQPTDDLNRGDDLSFSFTVEVEKEIPEAMVEVGVSTADGIRVITAFNTDMMGKTFRLEPGRHVVSVNLQTSLLPGDFTVDCGICTPDGLTFDFVDRVLTFRALSVSTDGGHHSLETVRGSVSARSNWTVRATVDANAAPSLTQ